MSICKACATGADFITAKPNASNIVAAARELHFACKGCDCQHKVDAQVKRLRHA